MLCLLFKPVSLAQLFEPFSLLDHSYFSLLPVLHTDSLIFETLLSLLQPPFLIVSDFNCRHILWGNSTTTSLGRSLDSFLSTTDIIRNSYHLTVICERNRFHASLSMLPFSLFILPLVNSRPLSCFSFSYFLIPQADALREMTGIILIHSLLFFFLHHPSRPRQICFFVSVRAACTAIFWTSQPHISKSMVELWRQQSATIEVHLASYLPLSL